jgi:hypothetical protein
METSRKVLPSLLAASVVAAMTFSLAWLRVTDLSASLNVVLGAFILYGVATVLISLVVGWPIAFVMARYRLLRWWTSVATAASFGMLLAWLSTAGGADVEDYGNPFRASFSPWTRDKPGFVDDAPFSNADFIGSLALGAIVGAIFGLVFWLLFTRGARSNISLQRDRVG